MLNYYGSLAAELYDIDKPIGHSFGDIEYYLKRLQSCKGKILEPAVGTGRMMIPLLENGLDIEGFDASLNMLEICQKYCDKKGYHPELFVADMVTFNRDIKYDAVILSTGTFLLIHEREKSISALKNFHHHLKPNGRLIIDLIFPSSFYIGEKSIKSWVTPDGDFITTERTLIEVDFIDQYTTAHTKYEKWRDGSLIQTELERYPIRWYGIEEFKSILESIGFKEIIISSDYKYGEYPTHKNLVITFEAVADK